MTDLRSFLTLLIVLFGFTAPVFGASPRITSDCERIDSRLPLDNGPRACFAEPYYVVMQPMSGIEGWAAPGGIVDVLAVFNSEEKGQWVKVVGCGAMIVSADSYRCSVGGKTWVSIGIILSEPQRQFLLQLEKRSDLSQFSLSLTGDAGTGFASMKIEERITKLCECEESCKMKAAIVMSTEGQITGLNEHCGCQKDCLGVQEFSGVVSPEPQKPRVSKGPRRTKIRMNGRSYKLERGKLVPETSGN